MWKPTSGKLQWKASRLSNKLRKALRRELSIFPALRAAEDTALLLTALLLLVLGINWINSGQPILGLRLGGQLVGQLNSDFRSHANSIIQDYEDQRLTVHAADETSEITLRQLGVNIEPDKIHADLLSKGKNGSALDRLSDQGLAPLGLLDIRLGHPDFDSKLAKQYIGTLNQKITRAPENAYFIYWGQKAIIRPDKPGRAIDADSALKSLQAANPMEDTQVALPIQQMPATVTKPMLEPLLSEVQAIAKKPLTISAGESKTMLSPQQLVELIVPKISVDPGDPSNAIAQITFDESKLNAVVDETVGRVVKNPKPKIISSGAVIQQGESGVKTMDDNSVVHVLAALLKRQTGASEPDEAQIPLVSIDPPVIHQATPSTRTGTGLVRLTFDDGPGGYTDQILDILGRYRVHASFYVVGRNVPGYAAQMQRTVSEGHKVCNHSYNHANLARLSQAGVHEELASTQSAIQQATGVTPNCFRPPYGAHNATVRSVAVSLGLSVDMWSVDPRDWARPGSSVIRNRVLSSTHSGAVILLHVLSQQTVDALPSIIEGVRAQGYTLE